MKIYLTYLYVEKFCYIFAMHFESLNFSFKFEMEFRVNEGVFFFILQENSMVVQIFSET